eukprot:Sro8_g006530.3  (262) ;mRNA; r:29405-30190
MVIDEFDNGFAPEVTVLPGFQEYASAKTGDATTVFFMNIFETSEDAKAAQEGAKTFVQKGALNGAITPNQFTETVLNFWVQHADADECNTGSFVDQFMGTQLWTLTEDAVLEGNWTIESVADELEMGFAPTIVNMDGFLEYGGASVTNTDFVFFYHVFETLEGVQQFRADAEAFVTDHPELNTVLDKIVFTEGVVGFDYTCVSGNLPAEADGADAGGDGDSSSSSSSSGGGETDGDTGESGGMTKTTSLTTVFWMVLSFFF